VIVGAQAGVHDNIPGGTEVLGSPAVPKRDQLRIFQMIARLPEMRRQLKEIAAQVKLLTLAQTVSAPPESAGEMVASGPDRSVEPEVPIA
jgi:UDP-3-O-[3-hydroxymyristoyl] glucosamine N-acyltransferase